MPRTRISSYTRAGQRGFTLTELIVVIAIMGILVSIAAYNMTDYIRRSRLQEAARNLDGDLSVVRNTARVRQLRNVVINFPIAGGTIRSYRAFIDTNDNLVFDAGDENVVNREFLNGVQLAITSSTPGAVAPFNTVRYTAIGQLRDFNRVITVTLPSLPARQFRVTVFTTGVTRVDRSDDSGVSFPTRAW